MPLKWTSPAPTSDLCRPGHLCFANIPTLVRITPQTRPSASERRRFPASTTQLNKERRRTVDVWSCPVSEWSH